MIISLGFIQLHGLLRLSARFRICKWNFRLSMDLFSWNIYCTEFDSWEAKYESLNEYIHLFIIPVISKVPQIILQEKCRLNYIHKLAMDLLSLMLLDGGHIHKRWRWQCLVMSTNLAWRGKIKPCQATTPSTWPYAWLLAEFFFFNVCFRFICFL